MFLQKDNAKLTQLSPPMCVFYYGQPHPRDARRIVEFLSRECNGVGKSGTLDHRQIHQARQAHCDVLRHEETDIQS